MAFVFYSNRAVEVFKVALTALGGSPWQAQQKHIDLMYFDTYGGKQAPPGLDIKRSLMPRQHTAPLDQKHLLARRLLSAGITSPRHFLSPKALPREPETLWYVKHGQGTGGQDIRLCRTDEVEQYFKPGFVIQEALTDIALFNDKKFTIRTYVLVFDDMVYWYPEAFLVLHALRYDPKALNDRIHFNHQGYMRRMSDVQLLATRYYAQFPKLESALVELLQTTFMLFAPELHTRTAGDGYCLFGVDLLQLPDHKVALIEINDRPNFIHTKRINQEVNQPMLQALAGILIPEKLNPRLHPNAQRFEELCFFE